MSITKYYSTSQGYFESCIAFLRKYTWIYETSNTCFIRENVLDNFPLEWVEFFSAITLSELNAFPDRTLQSNIPTLDEFLEDINKLIPTHNRLVFAPIDYKFKKMGPKKQHEVSVLCSLIQTTVSNDIDVIVDVGSGLGYLSEVLYRVRACKIIGLEADLGRVQTSIQRQNAIYPDSVNKVVFKQHFVTSHSNDFILNESKNLCAGSENVGIAIVGLHACADLTINAMKLFLHMENVRKLIVMPCCYHKLELDMETEGYRFRNFPLSDVLKESSALFQGFNRSFLRLACQQTSKRWKRLTKEDHYAHSIEMFLRAAVEAILNPDEMVVKSSFKKPERYYNINNWRHIYELHSKTDKTPLPWTLEHSDRFEKILQRHPFGLQLSEALTCLQTTMQSLCENVVLYDRICYMEEQAAKNNLAMSVKFEKIMDDSLSPRCFALIAQKM